MVLLLALLLIASTWALGSLQLWPRTRWIVEAVPWLGGALGLAVAACVAWGVIGIVQYGGWGSLSNDQALHRLLGPGNLLMRRPEWSWLDRADTFYMQLDIAWTLLALCVASQSGLVFWAGAAERRRKARVRRERRNASQA